MDSFKDFIWCLLAFIICCGVIIMLSSNPNQGNSQCDIYCSSQP